MVTKATCLALLCIVVMCNGIKLDTGNNEARAAFDAALLELWQDETYADLYRTWFNSAPERLIDCEEDPTLSYPTEITRKGLLDYIVESSSIRLGYYGPLAVRPGFNIRNNTVTGGFYPSLAETILDRISLFYQIAPIQITWVEIADIPSFYSDHVSGLYDVIFMNLFKEGMWSSPVARRDEIWNFSCSLLTAEPLRFYVCPSAVTKNLDLTSVVTIDGPGTVVQYVAGGAQEEAAAENFPMSQRSAAVNLSALFSACEGGQTDIIVELPNRITDAVEGFVVESQPIGTCHNTGAAFRLDAL